MKMKSLICSFALVLGFAGVAQAHEDVNTDGKFTVLFGGGKLFTDSDRNADDGNVGELGLGYIINKHWAVEAIYSQIEGIETDAGADVDAYMARLDGLYHFNTSGHWTPYLAGGVGHSQYDVKGGDDEKEAALNFGGGVKYALSKELTARADVRAVYGTETDNVDTLATIGFNYIFGMGSTPVAAAPSDSDGDGVLDADDQCPNTPAGVAVDAKGCALDSDRDGVPDYLDKCPGTKRDVRVDSDGCPMMDNETVSIELEVLFDVDKAVIKPEYMAEIQHVASFMKKYKNADAVIEGHSDSTGTTSYNKSLSQKRADAVLDALISKMDVNSNRLSAVGYGEERPRATNDTREGRKLNRRVVAVLKAHVEKVMKK